MDNTHIIKSSIHFWTVTSPIEGCHATLKLYLQRGHADLGGGVLEITTILEVEGLAELFSRVTYQSRDC